MPSHYSPAQRLQPSIDFNRMNNYFQFFQPGVFWIVTFVKITELKRIADKILSRRSKLAIDTAI